MRFPYAVLMVVAAGMIAAARGAQPAGLVLESTIVLGDVRGRIDHLAIGARTALFDPLADRLYVAARATSSAPATILVLRPY